MGEELDHARKDILALEETSKDNANAKSKLQSGIDEAYVEILDFVNKEF